MRKVLATMVWSGCCIEVSFQVSELLAEEPRFLSHMKDILETNGQCLSVVFDSPEHPKLANPCVLGCDL